MEGEICELIVAPRLVFHSSGVIFVDLDWVGAGSGSGDSPPTDIGRRRLQAGDRTNPPAKFPALAALTL